MGPPSGPTFVDFPMDHVFSEAEDAGAPASMADPLPEPVAEGVELALKLLDGAERPVVMAGSNLYWGHGENALRELIERRGIPVFLNGLARGCVAADHELFFSRARRQGLGEADVALVVGVPMDFRLGFGAVFGEQTEIVLIDRSEPQREPPREVAVELYGGIAATLAGAGRRLRRNDTGAWVSALRASEDERRAGEQAELDDPRAPLHPMRLYKELGEVLDRDAIIVCDGGDFVSYAGRMIDSYEPGCWLDPGPFGCLGTGPGYALAAKLAHPDRQVVMLLGDGAFGFSGMEFDTLARHGVDAVGVMGNNGIWGAGEAPDGVPLRLLGRRRAATGDALRQVVEALGGHGELVARPTRSSRRSRGRSSPASRRWSTC